MGLFVRDKSFYRKLTRLAVPVVLQSVITIGINMMDTLMLGSFGEAQLSASSLSNQFYNIYQILCMGMGMGTSVITAQYWGRNDTASIRKAITLMLRIAVIIAMGFFVWTAFGSGGILSIYTKDQAVISYGQSYYRFLKYTYLFQGISLTLTLVYRSVGTVIPQLISSICAFFLNILFNYMFIFGRLGAPRMEIGGAAVGTLIARIFETGFLVGYILWKDKKIRYRVRDFFRPCSDLMKTFLSFSMPVIISDLLLALGNNAVAVVMGRIGSDFVAANAITMVTVQISTIFIQGLSSAGSNLIGQVLGQKEREKAYRQGVTITAIGALVGVAGGIVITILSPVIVDFYHVEPHTREIAMELMHAVAFIVVFQSMGSVLTKGVLRGGGDTRFLMIADILFLWLASVPLGMLAAFVLAWPPGLIYCCLKIDLVIKSIWCLGRLVSRKWLREV